MQAMFLLRAPLKAVNETQVVRGWRNGGIHSSVVFHLAGNRGYLPAVKGLWRLEKLATDQKFISLNLGLAPKVCERQKALLFLTRHHWEALHQVLKSQSLNYSPPFSIEVLSGIILFVHCTNITHIVSTNLSGLSWKLCFACGHFVGHLLGKTVTKGANVGVTLFLWGFCVFHNTKTSFCIFIKNKK